MSKLSTLGKTQSSCPLKKSHIYKVQQKISFHALLSFPNNQTKNNEKRNSNFSLFNKTNKQRFKKYVKNSDTS